MHIWLLYIKVSSYFPSSFIPFNPLPSKPTFSDVYNYVGSDAAIPIVIHMILLLLLEPIPLFLWFPFPFPRVWMRKNFGFFMYVSNYYQVDFSFSRVTFQVNFYFICHVPSSYKFIVSFCALFPSIVSIYEIFFYSNIIL